MHVLNKKTLYFIQNLTIIQGKTIFGAKMYRSIETELISWMHTEKRLPLLIRGARQVGKTYSILKFGKEHFETIAEINFELMPQLKEYFKSLDPEIITAKLEIALNVRFIPGKTLLFLDEIQECPNALMALRYFKEKMPDLHVIAAGSLLEFMLADKSFRMPVGRVQYLYLKPMTFKAFLSAIGQNSLVKYISEFNFNSEYDPVLHKQLLDYTRLYCIIGGMPAVVQCYIDTGSLTLCQRMQLGLLNTFRDDFGKYSSRAQNKYLQQLYLKAPQLIAHQFKYVDVAKDIQSRDIKSALAMLCKAGILYSVYSTSATGLPLNALLNEKMFKLLFLDIGLLMATTELDGNILVADDLTLVHRGELAEQFVGQELLALSDFYREANIYYWHNDKRGSQAEVDYVINVGATILPIEVKAGSTGRMRSLNMFIDMHDCRYGLRISQKPFEITNKIVSIPFYLISEISRLFKSQ